MSGKSSDPLPPAPPQDLNKDLHMGEAGVPRPWQGDWTEEMQETNPAEVETIQTIEVDQEREEFSGTSPVHDFQSLTTTPPVLDEAQTIIPVVNGAGPVTIYFAEGKGSESDMMDPIEAHDCILSLTVDLDDPNSLVELEQQVQVYFQKGMRICDRGWKNFAVQDCYAVATDPNNGNSLFLVPNNAIRVEAKAQDYVEPNGGNQAMQRQSQLQEAEESQIQTRRTEAKRVQQETEQILQANKNDEAQIQARNIEAKQARQKTEERLQAINEAEAQIQAQDVKAKRSQQETEQRLQAINEAKAQIQAQNKKLERVQQETELEFRNAKEAKEAKEATERDLAEKKYRKQKEREDEIEEAVSDLLEEQRVNSANSRILDKTIIICFKERIGPSHDVSKPAGAWEWKDLGAIEVPMGDPHGLVRGKVNHLWSKANLQPHNSDLKKLNHEDCYMAAEEDRKHTLYFMVSNFVWKASAGRKPYASPKAPQEPTGLELGLYRTQVPPKVQLLKHREKIGKGLGPKKFEYTREDTSPQIRKQQNGKRTAESADPNPWKDATWLYQSLESGKRTR
jgi:chemotaxis protein histidine kinase CheA